MERGEGLRRGVSICVIIMALCGLTGAQYGGGAGTADDPYLIYTAEEMNAIGADLDDLDKHFKLMANIDLSAYASDEFNAIGRTNIRGGRPFSGVFDGNGHTISNLMLIAFDERYGGLFACVAGPEAIVRNLDLLLPHVDVVRGYSTGALVGRLDGGTVVNCRVVGGSVSGGAHVGGLAGSNHDGTIDRCYADVAVSGTDYVGGLVGENDSDTVMRCGAEGQVSGICHVGGLVGINYGTVTDCNATGAVSGSQHTGGLTGYNDHGSLTNCSATGRVTGGENTGGLVGINWEGSVGSCHATGEVTGAERTGGLAGSSVHGSIAECSASGRVAGEDRTGGLVGQSSSGTVTSSYATGLVSGGNLVGGLVGYCLGGFWGTITIGSCYATGDASGDISVGGLVGYFGTYQIAHCYATGAATGTDYCGGLVGKLGNGDVLSSFWDVQSSGLQESAAGTGLTTAEMMTAETFVGWGGCGSVGMWTLDEGNDYPRLWWEKWNTDSLEIPSLANVLDGAGTGDDPFQVRTAEQFRLIGFHRCSWDKHFVLMADIDLSKYRSGEVQLIGLDQYQVPFKGVFNGNGHTVRHFSYRAAGEKNVGLFGCIAGPDAEVKNLGLVAPDVDGGAALCSGSLVGCLWEGAVRHCYVDGGFVSGQQDVGGLVGNNGSTMANCYANSGVSGVSNVGGLVGNSSGRVVECYSTGRVEGTEETGGLVGHGNRIVARSFWDTETSGQDASAGGRGITTSEMQDVTLFVAAGWDFLGPADGPSDLWIPDIHTGRPILWWQIPPGERPRLSRFSGGTGTADDPYQISTAEQLSGIGQNPRLMAAHFVLACDIDMGDVTFFPIGDEGTPFRGSFDGDGKTVSNLIYAPAAGRDFGGLFGQVRGREAYIKNIGLIDPSIELAWGSYGGSLIGYLREGAVSDCYATGGVLHGYANIGGLMGYVWEGTVTDCRGTNVVSGSSSSLGGLVAFNHGGTLLNSTAGGRVNGYGDCGGLVGGNNGTICGCGSTADVSGVENTGGLVGNNKHEGIITNCHSVGATDGTYRVGGLVGNNVELVTNCFCSGTVYGAERVGGLVGHNRGHAKIASCYASGAVTGSVDVGGLVGHGDDAGTIAKCYAAGAVVGEIRVGGLVGQNGDIENSTNMWATIDHCYSTGSVSGQTDVGGLVGWDGWDLAAASFWDVETSGQTVSAGGTGSATAEMTRAATFVEAGWDFAGETKNGEEDVWWIAEGQDYPRLWWELGEDG